MRRIVTRSQAIKYACLIIIAMVILSIYPLRMWNEQITTNGKQQPAGSITVGGDKSVIQQFTAEYDHIASIGVWLNGEYYDDTLTMRVFDSNFTLLREETVTTVGNGYCDVYLNLDTGVGETYYYSLEGVSTDFQVLYEMTGNSGTANNGYMQYDGEIKEPLNVISRYNYEQPMRKGRSLLWIAGLTALAVLICMFMDFLGHKITGLQSLCTMQWILKAIGNPLVVIALIVALICIIPLHMFSIYIADMIILSIGAILLAGLLLYAINHKRVEDSLDLATYISNNWQNLAQSVCVALALWACIGYMNSLYEIFHDIAWRKMVFFLGLGLIVTFTRRELFNWYNLALLVIGVIAGRIYYAQNLPDMVDEYHVEAMTMTCRLFPVLLILAAYIIRCLVLMGKRQDLSVFRIISWPYTIITIIMAAAMVIKRNTRYWPVMMLVVVAMIAVRMLAWNRREAFIGNVCNGVLIHFFACVVYCLLHRPWDANIYVRFPFVFHTVTITAEYLSLVVAIALVKLLAKYNRTHKMGKCIGEMVIFGTAASYILFTMSRTGMIAVAAMGLTMWVAYSWGKAGTRLRSLGLSALLVIVSLALCMPVAFGLQKTVPALVGEPQIMEIETYPETLRVSKDYDSEEYITITRFAKAFANKMLGINEDKITWDKYTINGVRDELYLSPQQLYEMNQSSQAEPVCETAGILLSREANQSQNILTGKSNFQPPREWPEEGEPPEQWWSEDYWVYFPETDEWVFALWKIDDEANADISNGRMDIYRAYYEQLTMDGHENMSAILQDGSEAAHAHDIYLQVAFDHGIIVGVLFIIWVIMTCIQALIVFLRRRDVYSDVGMLLAVSVTYAVAGITEWISHPCNPVGMVMMLLIVPLAFYKYGKEN